MLNLVLRVNGQRASAGARHPHHPARRAARASRPDRHQEGLRPRPVRRLHGAGRRRARAVLPDARRQPCAAPVTTIEGLAGAGRRAAPDAAGLHRPRRLPVRLLHAGADHVGGRLRAAKATPATTPNIREYMSGNLCRCAAYPQHRRRDQAGRSRRWRSLSRCAPSSISAPTTRRAPSRAARRPQRRRPGAAAQFLAGGTTLLDLMKLDVMRPERLVDINGLPAQLGRHRAPAPTGLRLGALARMAEAADHPEVRRDYPVIAQSLRAGRQRAAPQHGDASAATCCSAPAAPISATPSWAACNKREPGLRLRRARRRQPQARGARRQRALHRHLSGRFRAGAGRARRARSRSSAPRGPRAHPVRRRCTACPATRRISRPCWRRAS